MDFMLKKVICRIFFYKPHNFSVFHYCILQGNLKSFYLSLAGRHYDSGEDGHGRINGSVSEININLPGRP